MKIVWQDTVENTTLDVLSEYLYEGLHVIVCKIPEKRSLSQNALYWSWLSIIARETGNDKEDLHFYFRQKFNLTTIFIGFDVVEVGKSTRNLTTQEFTEYLDKVKQFALNELDINLPEPNQVPIDVYLEEKLKNDKL